MAAQIRPPGYPIWRAMRARCRNRNDKDYARYGGRGIKVCERWDSFAAFQADMWPPPSKDHMLDRIDNDGDYEPSNCRWVLRREQMNNKHNNTRIKFRGETKTAAAWSVETGLPQRMITARIRLGWSAKRALTTPPGPRAKVFKETTDG